MASTRPPRCARCGFEIRPNDNTLPIPKNAEGERKLPPEALRCREKALAALDDEARKAVGERLHASLPHFCHSLVVRDIAELAASSRRADAAAVRMQLLVKTVTRSGERHSIEWVECEPVRRPAPSVRVRVRVSVSLPPALAGPQLPARPIADRQRPGGEGEADLHGQLGEDHF